MSLPDFWAASPFPDAKSQGNQMYTIEGLLVSQHPDQPAQIHPASVNLHTTKVVDSVAKTPHSRMTVLPTGQHTNLGLETSTPAAAPRNGNGSGFSISHLHALNSHISPPTVEMLSGTSSSNLPSGISSADDNHAAAWTGGVSLGGTHVNLSQGEVHLPTTEAVVTSAPAVATVTAETNFSSPLLQSPPIQHTVDVVDTANITPATSTLGNSQPQVSNINV